MYRVLSVTSALLWLCVAAVERGGRGRSAPSVRNTPCVSMGPATSQGSVTVKKDGEDSFVIKVSLNTNNLNK